MNKQNAAQAAARGSPWRQPLHLGGRAAAASNDTNDNSNSNDNSNNSSNTSKY